MLRKVTLKPFTSPPNVSPTSRMIDDIATSLANRSGASKSGSNPISQRTSRAQCLNNLFPVEAAVFDEYLPRVPPADNHSRQIDPGHVTLPRVRIQRRLAAFWIQLHAQTVNEREIGLIPAQRE